MKNKTDKNVLIIFLTLLIIVTNIVWFLVVYLMLLPKINESNIEKQTKEIKELNKQIDILEDKVNECQN